MRIHDSATQTTQTIQPSGQFNTVACHASVRLMSLTCSLGTQEPVK